MTKRKQKVKNYFDSIAEKREKYIRRNKYYYDDMKKFLKYNIPANKNVLEVGCGTGHILASTKPQNGVGVDISPKLIEIASQKYPNLKFVEMDAENLKLDFIFDFIIISDTLVYLEDIQKFFNSLSRVCDENTRIIITTHSFLWQPLLTFAEKLRLKMPNVKLNWLSISDIENLLTIEDFDIIKKDRRMLFPKNIPIISWFINKYIANLPVFNSLCITNTMICRFNPQGERDYNVSVVIPARNEEGNIENAIKRMPRMGKHTEVIYIEGGSSDCTYDEIKRAAKKYGDEWDIKYARQDGKGKGDAVRKGFGMANGDVLMILDADLTVPPEDLTKFYNAIASGKGEYINGSRLVYPMEKEAMRFLNLIGNKFFSIMFTWLLGQPLKDTLCGTKVLTSENWQKIVENRSYFGEFDPFGDYDLIFGASKLNLKFIEIPIRYRAREYGDTNISRFKHGLLLLKMTFFAMNKIKFK